MARFSDRLKELRRESGYSQQSLADRIGGISKSSINMYERGEREPGFETMEAIADHYNVDMDYLYGRTNIRNAYEKYESYTIRNGDTGEILESGDDYYGAFPEKAKAIALRIDRDPYTRELFTLITRTLNTNGEEELLKFARLLALDPKNCMSEEDHER